MYLPGFLGFQVEENVIPFSRTLHI
jgi:hypothetical protein